MLFVTNLSVMTTVPLVYIYLQVNASSDLTSLVQQMGSDWHWAWIRTRVEYMWTEWHESAQTLLHKHQKMRRYKAKKVKVNGSFVQTFCIVS